MNERPTGVRWTVMALTCATSWMLYLHRYSWGLIKSDVGEEYGLDKVQLGWLDSAFGVSYMFFQVPGGLAGDLFGTALVIPLLILAWSLAVGGTGLCQGYGSFFAVRMIFGATQAGAYPNVSKVTRSWFPLKSRTTVQGLVTAFGRMGGACAMLVVSTILMGYCEFGWRTSLAIIAGMGIVLAILHALLFRSSPGEDPRANEAERRLIEGEDSHQESSPKAKVKFVRSPAVMLSFGALLFHIFTSAAADQLYVYWVPSFLQEAKGLSKVQLGIFASLPLFGGALGGLVGGILNDWVRHMTGSRRWARTAVGATGKIIAAGVIAYAISIDDGRQMMVVVAIAKFFTDWSQPSVWGTVTDISGRATGRVFGIVNTFGSIGGFAVNPIYGFITKSLGWSALFWTIAGIYVVSGLSWLLIDASRPLVRDGDE